MTVTLSGEQLTTLSRYDRSYNVKKIDISEHPMDSNVIVVNAVLRAGKGDIEQRFIINGVGKLVKEVEDNSTNT